MAKLLLLFALCVVPALLVCNVMAKPFTVRGRVYCDTCRCGFETRVTTYIPDARVRIECKDRASLKLVYSIEGKTDSTGTYNILVEDDHEDEICNAVLISSPVPDCRTPDLGRNRAPAIVTRDNGAISNLHYANAMGFMKDKALPVCAELLKELLQDDE